MKKPKNFEELFKLVSPRDLLEVINFSGIKDHKYDEFHGKKRRELQDKLSNSIFYKTVILGEAVGEVREQWRNPHNRNTKMEDIYYEIIIDSLQSFYYWSHQHNHIYAHIHQRVMNALEIPIEDISIIMKEVGV